MYALVNPEVLLVGIVLLAMVAAFLALRLYSVLGKRTGHEQTYVAPPEATRPALRVVENAPVANKPVADTVYEPGAEAGIRAIVAAEPGFDVGRFLEGAKAAYRMILEAFWRGDAEALASLTTPEVRDAFTAAIEERRAAGQTLENRLIGIENATITEARLFDGVADITVRFDADIAAVTRDAEGQVVAGSLSDAVTTHDAWTFSRTLRASDPNWLLADTDESE